MHCHAQHTPASQGIVVPERFEARLAEERADHRVADRDAVEMIAVPALYDQREAADGLDCCTGADNDVSGIDAETVTAAKDQFRAFHAREIVACPGPSSGRLALPANLAKVESY